MKQLQNRVAVVTGAASGIGRATSVLLAKQGCRMALADVDQQGLEETRRQIVELGGEATCHRVDVSDKERMQRFVDEVLTAHGGVHLVVNNAGVTVDSVFTDQSLEDFEWLMGINFWGVVYGCKFFLPHLLAAEEGHIVNISSVFGLLGVARQTSYCASKFAVRGFSESLRAELVGSRVGVTSVHPGGVATNIVVSSRVTGDEHAHARHQKAIKMFKRMMPPETAAQRIVDGIRGGRSRVLITRESHVIDFVRRVAPSASNALVDWSFKRLQ